MRSCSNTALRVWTAPLLVYGLLVLCAPRVGAQSADSTHWSVFGSHTTSSAAGADRSFGFPSENFGVGGRVEFKSLIGVPLRATLSYDKFRSGPSTTLKATSLMADAVFRPLAAMWGIRPYLVVGLGIATVSPSGTQVQEGSVLRVTPIARTTALEMDAGFGLENRRFFMEYRRSPYSVLGDQMPSRTPIRLGFRF
ncbi:MAG: hypothetical protein ABJE47_19585 [bacterium]